jgi:serine/threonine protein kinase
MQRSVPLEAQNTSQLRVFDLSGTFQKAWLNAPATQEAPNLSQFLPPADDPLRLTVLHELIKIDLQRRWQRQQAARLEDYVGQFPELDLPGNLPAELIHEEYCIRHLHGDKPELYSYQARFPTQFPTLCRLVEEQPAQTLMVPGPFSGSSGTASNEIATLAPPSTSPSQPVAQPDLIQISGTAPAPPPSVAPAASSATAASTRDGRMSIAEGYKLIKRLGGGSFGEVWRAEAPGGIEVAVKIITRPLDDETSQRELQSLELIKRLRHPYLLSTQAYWSLEDRLFIAMELADGSLSDRLKECRKAEQLGIPPAELLGYFREAAEAVDYLNSQNVQHRDLKPDNILLLQHHVKVADFGLARLQENMRSVAATFCGTPAFMAPEVWKGKISTHSDQYSLALTYIQVRLGRQPFPSRDLHQLMMEHLEGTPDLAPLSDAEQRALLKALAKDPAQRYDSCRDFVRALEEALTDDLKQQSSLPAPAGSSDESGKESVVSKETLVKSAAKITAEMPVDALTTVAPGPAAVTQEMPTGRPHRGWMLLLAVPLLVGAGLGIAYALRSVGKSAGTDSGTSISDADGKQGRSDSFALEKPAPVLLATGKQKTIEIRFKGAAPSKPVSLQFEGQPAGVTIAAPQVAAGENSAHVAITANPKAKLGTHQVHIRAEGGSQPQEASFELKIAFLPAGYEPASEEIVQDKDDKSYFARIVRTVKAGGQDMPVVFLAMPRTKDKNDPDTFYIMETKVSVRLYNAYAAEKGQKPWKSPNPEWTDEDFPVLGLKFSEAFHFAEWMNGKLPTVDQWDRAAGFYWPKDPLREGPYLGDWSKDPKPEIALQKPMKVGMAKQDISPFQCRDMAGNGNEWTRMLAPSGTAPRGAPVESLELLKANPNILLRGRALDPAPDFPPLQYKDFGTIGVYPPNQPGSQVGFRVVLEPES